MPTVPIIAMNEYHRQRFVDAFDNGISFYYGIEGKLTSLVDILLEVVESGSVQAITTAYRAVSDKIDSIRNEKVASSSSSYTTAEGFFVVMWNSGDAGELGPRGGR